MILGERMTSRKDKLREAKQKERLEMSEEKKEEQRQAARMRMSERRAAMTLEEKEERKAKDRERKAKKNQAKKAKKEESSEEKQPSKKYYNEKDANMMYKRKTRENESKEEKELRKIEHVIQMRKHRAARTEEKIAVEKRLAKEEMKHMRKFGKIATHCTDVSKYTANVPRKKRPKDAHEMWKTYCLLQRRPRAKEIV